MSWFTSAMVHSPRHLFKMKRKPELFVFHIVGCAFICILTYIMLSEMETSRWLLLKERYSSNLFGETTKLNHFLEEEDAAFSRHESSVLGSMHAVCPRANDTVAIVMPLIPDHIDLLRENLLTWSQYFPCSSGFVDVFEAYRTFFPAHFSCKVKLFFYFNGRYDYGREQQVLSIWESVKGVKQQNDKEVFIEDCFAGAPTILWANLRETTRRPAASKTKQFIKAFELLKEHDVKYFFYMQPDTWPIRSNWLEKIYFEAVCGNDFWVKGSTFRNQQEFKQLKEHINANALYNIHDTIFMDWIVELIKSSPRKAFDYLMGEKLKRIAVGYTNFFRDNAHMFIHIDWIYNYGNKDYVLNWKPWSIEEMYKNSPNTYLVHGKKE